MQQERRYFIPQQVTGTWQFYGLPPRHLWRLSGLLVVLPVTILVAYLLCRWGVPGPGLVRMILRSLYVLLFPVSMSAAWIGLMVIPVADAGRTWWEVRRLAQTHHNRQTLFLPRHHLPPPTEPVAPRPEEPTGATVTLGAPQFAPEPQSEGISVPHTPPITPTNNDISEIAVTTEGTDRVSLSDVLQWTALISLGAVLLWVLYASLTGKQPLIRLLLWFAGFVSN